MNISIVHSTGPMKVSAVEEVESDLTVDKRTREEQRIRVVADAFTFFMDRTTARELGFALLAAAGKDERSDEEIVASIPPLAKYEDGFDSEEETFTRV